MNKKKFIFLLFGFIALVLYSCGGGGGSSSSEQVKNIPINSFKISRTLISKSDPKPITFSWRASCLDTESYHIDIYLSKDNKINTKDYLLVSTTKNVRRTQKRDIYDSITLNPGDSGYDTIMSAYGGRYYVIFNLYSYNGDVKEEGTAYVFGLTLKTKWTIMVYMDGDNSLDNATYYDINEMENVGSDSNVNVVVQDDTYSDSVKRYFIEPFGADLLSDLGELNMADYHTLSDFGSWTVNNFPADHYLLVLWDHGLGFEDIQTNSSNRDIIWDSHTQSGLVGNTNSMSIPDLEKALIIIKNSIGQKIDIVGMDACLMNMAEVAYEIDNSTDYLLGSENTEPFDGWPYDRIIDDLETHITFSPSDFAKKIVNDYMEFYTSDYTVTQSAVDLSKINSVAVAVNNLAQAIIDNITVENVQSTLQTTIFNDVQRFDENGDGYLTPNDSYADLYDLAYLMANNDNMTQGIKDNATAVMSAVSSAVIANAYSGSSLSGSHGLSVWFPDSDSYSKYKGYYGNLQFAKNNKWSEMLDKLWTNQSY